MRKYIGEVLFNNQTFSRQMIMNSNHRKISDHFHLEHTIATGDFKIFNFPNVECTLIIDGEVYNFDFHTPINDLNFLKNIVFKLKNNDLSVLSELNGSFNIIFYNHNTNELRVINDRFSTRPLYYYKNKDRFIFSNSMTCIANTGKISKELNQKAILEFLKIQMVFGTKTLIKGIFAFKNATHNIIKSDFVNSQKYWFFKHNIDYNFNEEEYVERLSKLMVDIMNYKTNEDKVYGVFLSGGLDSRAVMAADSNNKITEVFTLGDSFNKECEISSLIADVKGANFNYIERDPDHYFNIVKESVEIGDGMYNYLNGHFIGILDQLKNKVDIIFNGSLVEQLWQGSKFIEKSFYIKGYKLSFPILEKETNSSINRLIRNFPRTVNNVKSIINQDLDLDPNQIVQESMAEMLKDNFNTKELDLQEAIDYLANDSYGRYISHLNQLCINNEINYRTLYDNRLIDLLLNVPIKYRNSGELLRKAIININSELSNVPLSSSGISLKRNNKLHWVSSIYNRLFNKLFRSNTYKSKSRSWPNYSKLIIENQRIQEGIQNIIMDRELISDEIFNREHLLKIFKEHIREEKDHSRILFQVYTFGEWYKLIK